MGSLKRELPTTFRVTGSRASVFTSRCSSRILPGTKPLPIVHVLRFYIHRSHAQSINDHITTTFTPMLQNVVLDGETQPAPKQLEWYPGQLAWQLNVPKRTIRKSPEYKVFQSFLVGETEIVSRVVVITRMGVSFVADTTWLGGCCRETSRGKKRFL